MEARFELETLIAAGELHKAYGKLPVATEKAYAANELSMPREWTTLLNSMGFQQLYAAETMIERGDVEEGLLEIQGLTTLRLLPVSIRANERMREARRDPDLQQALIEADAEALYQTAQDLMQQGEVLVSRAEDEARIEEADALLSNETRFPPLELIEPYMYEPIPGPPTAPEIAAAWALTDEERLTLFNALEQTESQFPDTQAGSKAKWTLEILERDEWLVTTVAASREEASARVLFEQAKFFLANNRPLEATRLFEQVIRDHPETEAAVEAKAELDRVRSAGLGP